MADFATSDWHLFHENILKYQKNRGIDSLDHMHHVLVNNYNNMVGPNDTCYFLGDIVMGNKLTNIPLVIPKLNGIKHLVLGNHDGGFHNKADSEGYIRKAKFYILNGFETVSRIIAIEPGIKGSHFPWRGVPDRESGREYLQKYAPVDDGVSVLLHGHSHQPEKVSGVRMIHIGVDAWDMKPAPMTEIKKLILENGW